MTSINKFDEIINKLKEENEEGSKEFSNDLLNSLNKEMSLAELEEIQDQVLDSENYHESIRVVFTSVVFSKTTKNISEMFETLDMKHASKKIQSNQDPATSVLLGLINLSCLLGLCFILS